MNKLKTYKYLYNKNTYVLYVFSLFNWFTVLTKTHICISTIFSHYVSAENWQFQMFTILKWNEKCSFKYAEP